MKKILFSMLALLLAMGGAWAQGPTIVWGDGTTNLILANNYTADGITFTTSDGSNVFSSGLWYFEGSVAFTSAGGNFTRIEMIIENNLNNSWNNQDGWTVDATTAVWEGDANQVVISRCTTYVKQITFICAEASIKLTPDATGKVWTLDETPDYDLDLNVVYYQKYALKEIPANWQVKVDGVDKTAAIDGDSLKISETAQVLLTPDHPEYVKSVRLLDVAVLVDIDGITLDITGCTTWADIIARNPGVIWDEDDWIGSNSGILLMGDDEVYTSDTYIPSANYRWQSI